MDKTANKPGTLSKIIKLLRPFRKQLFLLILLMLVISIIQALPPLISRYIINDIIGANKREQLFGIACVAIAIPTCNALLGFIQSMGVSIVGQRFILKLKMNIYKHLLNLHMGYFSKNSTGKLINRIMGDSTALLFILDAGSIQIIADMFCSTFAITAAFYINWRLSIILIIVLSLFYLNFIILRKRIRMAWKNFRTAGDRLASGVQNRLSANLTVKTYSAEERENIVFSEETNTASIYAHNGWKASSDNSFNAQLLQKFGHAAIFFIGCGMILNNSTTYGDVTAFVAYANMLFWPIIRFTMFAERLQNVRIAADRLFEILEEEPQVKEAENPITLKNVSGKVDFNNIHFEYEEGHPIICGFDLHVKPGETIALVGPTGCGKTTILSLLMRFWDVKEGSITIDGVDIREISKYSLKSLFGIVLQESLLFTTSIADNIRYARPSATMDEVINAAKIAEIHNEIMTLPRGYESVIGDKDVQLSVGQKQRISIARAVLANPTILIMDEATSSLDSRSESAIKQALDRFLSNKTSFIVAHRLSTIKNADKIILLDKGTIIEQGNHEELMQIENGRYRELYEKHSGAGIILDDSEAEE